MLHMHAMESAIESSFTKRFGQVATVGEELGYNHMLCKGTTVVGHVAN